MCFFQGMCFYMIFFTSAYALIETGYRQLLYGKYTTLGQTLITFLWTPCILLHFQIFNDEIYSVVLFPFNIWLCEVLFGLYFLKSWGLRFWFYNDSLSFFNHLISLSFYGYWFLLGMVIHDFLYLFPYYFFGNIQENELIELVN